MRKSVAAAIAAALLLSACTDDGAEVGFDDLPSESPSAEPTETASAEAPSDEIDVTTTPDEITPEWVTAVVNTLLAEYGEIEAEILATPASEDPTLPADVESAVLGVFAGEYAERSLVSLSALQVDLDSERDGLLEPSEYDGLRFTTELVQVADGNCIVAVGRVSRDGTTITGGTSEVLSAVSLAPREGASDRNPTPWVLLDELLNTNPEGAANPDEVMLNASLEDYGSSLVTTCGGER